LNATKNSCERSGIEDTGRDDNLFMVVVYRDFKDRLERLRNVVEKVSRVADDEMVKVGLERVFQAVEEADNRFIGSCAKAVAGGAIREHEVTRLLMANRFFSQSSRMLSLIFGV
jgi:hypothetical protein